MTQPFIGQIQPFAFGFPPKSWAKCDGQTLNIAQNQALFSLLGTFYGGNGTTTFLLPDLRGRVPLHEGTLNGTGYPIGQASGQASVALTTAQMPAHSHQFLGASSDATVALAAPNQALAKASNSGGTAANFYGPLTTPQPLNPASVSSFGQGQAHENMQPYLTLNWCISLTGLFPSRN
ncbi:MAG: microcystin-dependent protein [Rhodopseudomonas sp.]|nr:microcystin-dependent protein [Rhodopseudomonas sp.]